MFRDFYTAASGMISQQRRQDLLTNNLSNANTPGFKADQASLRAFPEMLFLERRISEEIPYLPKSRSVRLRLLFICKKRCRIFARVTFRRPETT